MVQLNDTYILAQDTTEMVTMKFVVTEEFVRTLQQITQSGDNGSIQISITFEEAQHLLYQHSQVECTILGRKQMLRGRAQQAPSTSKNPPPPSPQLQP